MNLPKHGAIPTDIFSSQALHAACTCMHAGQVKPFKAYLYQRLIPSKKIGQAKLSHLKA